MELPNYIRKKMSLFERFKLFRYKRGLKTSMSKLDYYIVRVTHLKCCKYETLMYYYDGKIEEYQKKMCTKYA
jgi:hypothetical protein